MKSPNIRDRVRVYVINTFDPPTPLLISDVWSVDIFLDTGELYDDISALILMHIFY